MTHIGRRALLQSLAAAAILPSRGLAQAAPAPLDDMAVLRGAMALHPGAMRYLTQVQLDAGVDSLAAGWPAQDRTARYLALSRFLATLRCGHSYANFFNQKKAVQAELYDRPTRLPFTFRWIAPKRGAARVMVVTGDAPGCASGLPAGTVVETLNGVATPDILARLLPYVRADGHNDAKRVALLGVAGQEGYETFDVFHGLLFAQPGAAHRLTVRRPDGRAAEAEVPIATLASRLAVRDAPRGDDTPLWQWAMRDDGIALLTMPDWATYDSKWDWRGWLAERLGSLGGAKGLMIDLRANEGGEDCGNPILARLAVQDLRFAGYDRRLRFRRTPAALNPHLDTWDDSFRTLGEGARDIGGGWFELPRERDVDLIAAVRPRIDVPVAALIGPNNSSATFQFAARARETGLIRLFGAPTGGNRRGINGGSFFFVRLPDSGIEFDLPLVGTFPATPQPDAGLEPNVTVADRIEDVIAGRDRAMDAAAKWMLGA